MKKIPALFFFLFILSGILYVGNLVVYEALVNAFHITTPTHLFLLGAGLGFLSASFLGASIIGSFYYNAFTRTYYLLSAVWIGLFVYLYLASLLYGIFVAFSLPYANIGFLLFFCACAISVYAVRHAQKIVITPVAVSLQNLPPSWKGRKMAWVSDVHFGQIYGASFAEKIATHIANLSPDIVFFGGDLYDGTGAPDIAKVTAPLQKVSAPFGVYFITGNHEEYGDTSRFLSTVESIGMRVLRDEMVEIDGLQLIGVEYRHASNPNSFKEILSKLAIDPTKASILLKHEPKDIPIAHAAGISLQISGHTHNAQMWPLNYIGQLVHRGFSYGLKRFENLHVYTSSGTGTWGPPMRVRTRSEIVLFTLE